MAGFAKVSEWVDECFDEPSSSSSLSRTSLNASDQVGRLNAGDQGGWQLNRRFQEQLHKIKYSESRELVVVESGLDWKLREMSEKYPEYCWKYAESSAIANYHFNLVASSEDCLAPSNRRSASLPVFYANIPYQFSPYDFSVRPKCFDKVCKQLREQMCLFYKSNQIPTLENIQLFAGMACAVKSSGEWRRARIITYRNGEDALTDLVDYGTENLVKTSNIRPLMKDFGRLPPLSLRCRMKDVSINDLTAAKVCAFDSLLKNECGGLVRVELADVSTVPLLVNIYHPTVEGYNLGSAFYRKEVPPEHEAARVRRWQQRCARINGINEEFDEDEQAEYVDETAQMPHVKYLNRLEKPVGQCRLSVCHVENDRLIYLHSDYHLKTIETIQKELFNEWSSLELFPKGAIDLYVACAYLQENNDEKIAYRVIISKIDAVSVEIRAADHGWKRSLPLEKCYAGSLRILSRQYSYAPLMYVCRFASVLQRYPHFSETLIIRRLMPKHSLVTVELEKSKRTAPYKAKFVNEKGEEISDLLEKIKLDEHVVHPCFDMVPHKLSQLIAILSDQQKVEYHYELEIFYSFAKGRLQLTDFSRFNE